MWNEIARYLPEFTTGVLTAFDSRGGPFSLRIQPSLDVGSQVIRFSLPASSFLQPGKACLLCHRHDQNLWNLKSFVVQGNLAQTETGWLLEPVKFIPGMGIGGVSSYLHFVTNGRKNTNLYLQKHNMPRPKVNWDEIMDLMAPEERDVS